MSIDNEINNIREAIARVDNTLYKLDNQLNPLLASINKTLGTVDEKLLSAVRLVNQIQNKVGGITKNFPLEWAYLALLLMIIILLIILCIYLVFYIHKFVREFDMRKDKEYRKYMKKTYQRLPLSHREMSIDDIETPPPTYDEYVETADLYVNYHQNGSFSSSIEPERA